jgi:cellulose synthase/poly-beta-1,6-N-acetylglucosamine synthase-like glycosyltransferase
MTAPEQSRISFQVAAFAWRVKNWLRPLGLSAFDLPCQLMGSGMAFPWSVIRSAKLASGSITEDLKLGLDLAAAGYPPLFCPTGCVTSEFPSGTAAAEIQHRRWEQGYLGTMLDAAPCLLSAAVRRRDLGLLALTLDLSVPPLSLLATLLTVTFAITSLSRLLGFGSVAHDISMACLIELAIAVSLAWWKCGRDVVPPRAILSVPSYIFRKLDFYRQVFVGRTAGQWIRTERTKP